MSNRLFTDDTGAAILGAIKQQTAVLAKGSSGLKVESYADVQSIVRMGLAPAVFGVGDVIEVGRETAVQASLGVHTGITAVSVVEDTFVAAMDEAGEKEYEIIFDGSAWKYEGAPIILADYGLSVTGTPAEGDTIIVVETASVIRMVVMDFIENGQTSIGNIPVHGILIGAGAGLFWAIYLMASKKSMNNGNHTFTILFYSVLVISVILIPFTNFSQIENFVSINPTLTILFLILHSTISFALPYIFSTISLSYIDSGVSSILLSGAEPLAALIFGFAIYSEIPTVLMFIGFILSIIAMTMLSKSDTNST